MSSPLLPKVAALAALLAVYRLRRAPRKDPRAKEDRPRKCVDHPFVVWLLENVGVVAPCILAYKLFPAPKDKSNLRAVAWSFLGRGITSVEVATFVQYLYINYVYAHIPFFSEKRPQPSLAEYTKDWLRTNLVTHLFAMCMQTYLAKVNDLERYKLLRNKPFHLLSFLKLLAMHTFLGDITFFVIHHILHSNKTLYKWIHKRHHEHYKTALVTNSHFTAIDLILEGFGPTIVSSMILEKFGYKASSFELTLLSTYSIWFELASHSGKEIPTISTYPPLAPLYNYVVPLDDRNVEFHEKHHNTYNKNYGITPWIEKLMGTAHYGLDGK